MCWRGQLFLRPSHPALDAGARREVVECPRRGVDLVKANPNEARPFLKGYTAIEGPLTAEVPMSDYLFSSDFKPADVAYFQKFYDLFTDKGIFERKVDVGGLLYKA